DGRDCVVEAAQAARTGAVGAAVVIAGIVAHGDAQAVRVADRGDPVVPARAPEVRVHLAAIHAEARAGEVRAVIEADIAAHAAAARRGRTVGPAAADADGDAAAADGEAAAIGEVEAQIEVGLHAGAAAAAQIGGRNVAVRAGAGDVAPAGAAGLDL